MTTTALIVEIERNCPEISITTRRTKHKLVIVAIDDPILNIHEKYTTHEQFKAREMLRFIWSQSI